MDSGRQRRPAKESHLSCCIVKPFSGFSHLPKVPPPLAACWPLRPRIDTQYLGKVGDFRQMPQRIVGLLGRSTEQIHVKDILPGVPLDRARLNLGQADIAQSKHAQSLEQGAWKVFHAEGNRRLIGPGEDLALLAYWFADQKEPGEVLFVVLDAGLENPASVDLGRPFARNGGAVAKVLSHDALDATRRVVKGNGLNLRVQAKELAALLPRYGVRIHSANLREFDARRGH